MIRIAKKIDPERISELKKKINEEAYLVLAINRIALTLTNKLLLINEDR